MDKAKYHEVRFKNLYVKQEQWKDASVAFCRIYDQHGLHIGDFQKCDLALLTINQEDTEECHNQDLSKDQIFDLFLETFANEPIFEVGYKDDAHITADLLTLQEAKDYVQKSGSSPENFLISCRVLQPIVSAVDFKKIVG